ncbi:ras-like protein family member 10B isoform X2 [Convolutriloba macropyga]
MPKRRTVAVLGASSVGKSSLVHQFMYCHLDTNIASHHKHPRAYFPNIFVNQTLYEVTIVDPPHCKDEDMFNMHEWAQLQFGCVNGREAEAFILVYDVSVPLTFKYIQVLREQINESFEDASSSDCVSGSVPPPILVVGNKCDVNKRAYPIHVVTEIVKKHWHCEYMECSAKYNWRVFGVFREIMMLIDSATPNTQTYRPSMQSSTVHSLIHHPFNHNWSNSGRRQSRVFNQFAPNSSYRRRRRQSISVHIPPLNKKGQSSGDYGESSPGSLTTINDRIRSYLASCISYCRTA